MDHKRPRATFSQTYEEVSGRSLDSVRLGRVFLDEQSLKSDLQSLSRLPFDSFYENYSRGSWKSISIMNRDGDSSNGESFEFEGRGRWTPHAAAVPYIKRLIEAEFFTQELKSARIFYAENGGMIVPHRDYLELKNGFVRLHLPIFTNERSISTEEDIAYHMAAGEIWFLDAHHTHAAANYSKNPRYHVVLDFSHRPPPRSLAKNLRPCERPITYCARASLPENFSEILDHIGRTIVCEHSVLRAFYLLCDYHFFYISNASDVYDWLIRAASASEDLENITAAEEIRTQFIGYHLA